VASVNQARANTASAGGHLKTQEATLRANQDLLNRTIAVAPFDGVVTNQPIREGETVVMGIQNAEGSTLMTLADLTNITAEVKVDETDIVNVRIGQQAEVTVDALPGKSFKGHVTLVGDQALLRSTGVATSQSTTGTEEAKDFKVVVTLDQVSEDLKPGLSATAKITTAHRTDALTIPIQALVQRNPEMEKAMEQNNGKTPGASGVAASTAPPPGKSQMTTGVYVLRTDHKKLRAIFVPVKTGVTGATDIEILNGLQPGDEIVTGRYKILRSLKSGTIVKRDNTPETVTDKS